MSDAIITNVNMTGVAIKGANMSGVALNDCVVPGMTINGILVTDMLASYEAVQVLAGSGEKYAKEAN